MKVANISRRTSGPKHYFYGYCAILPWDSLQWYHLVLEANFDDRAPTRDVSGSSCSRVLRQKPASNWGRFLTMRT